MKSCFFGLLSVVLAVGCTGEIDDPEAFFAALNQDGGALADDPGDAGMDDVGTATGADAGAQPVPPVATTTCEFYQDIQVEFIEPTCGSMGCHDPQLMAGMLDLVSPGLAERLVDVQSGSANCSGELFIDSSSVGESLLFRASTGQDTCSIPMPLTMPSGLEEEDAQCLQAWMEELIQSIQ